MKHNQLLLIESGVCVVSAVGAIKATRILLRFAIQPGLRTQPLIASLSARLQLFSEFRLRLRPEVCHSDRTGMFLCVFDPV